MEICDILKEYFMQIVSKQIIDLYARYCEYYFKLIEINENKNILYILQASVFTLYRKLKQNFAQKC